MKPFRQNSLYISDEVYTMLRIVAKAKHTVADMTADSLADCLLREKLTKEYPELVVLYSELEHERQSAKDGYKAIEKKMEIAVGGSKSSEPASQASDATMSVLASGASSLDDLRGLILPNP